MRMFTITLTACLLAGPAVAQEIRTIDGDTFELDGEVIRLWGIDAPEMGQTCWNGRRDVDVGTGAWTVLNSVLMTLAACDPVDIDRYGRTVAICATAQGWDIGAIMVGVGWAWEDVRYTNGAYADMTRNAEDQAGTPLYRGQCIPAWEWREGSQDR